MTLIKRISLLLLSTIFILVILEIALRIREDPKYYINPPNIERILKPSPEYIPGIYKESVFTTNSLGLRGSEPGGEPIKILTVGGSTTVCIYLDNTETWPYLLREKLNRYYGKKIVWIGNGAKSGCTTYENALQIKYVVPQYKDIKYIICMSGINDITRWLRKESRPEKLWDNLYLIFSYYPISFYKDMNHLASFSLHHGTLIAQRIRTIYYYKFLYKTKGRLQDSSGIWMVKLREERANQLVDIPYYKLITLKNGLTAYKSRLKKMLEAANENGSEMIFVTHPALWRADLTPKEESLLWLGETILIKDGNICFVNSKGMLKLLILFNRALINFCRDNKVFYIDLARKMEDERDIFYDDCHFNEKGARIVSDILYKDMIPIVGRDLKIER